MKHRRGTPLNPIFGPASRECGLASTSSGGSDVKWGLWGLVNARAWAGATFDYYKYGLWTAASYFEILAPDWQDSLRRL